MTWLEPGIAVRAAPRARGRARRSRRRSCCATAAPMIALGTPGGDQQDQWQLPVLLRMIVGRLHAAAGDRRARRCTRRRCVDSFWPRTWTAGGRRRRGPARRRRHRRARAPRPRRDPRRATGRSGGSRPSAAMPRAGLVLGGGEPARHAGLRRGSLTAAASASDAGRASSPRRAGPAPPRPRRPGACGPSPRTSGRRPRSTRSSRPGTTRPPPRAASAGR